LKANNSDDILEGTTRKVFRFVYRQHDPVGIHDIQRGMGLSSPSVAYYHVTKLLKAGLLKEEGDGYTVNKSVFENMIRLNKTVLPLQTGYAAFFLAALIILVTVLKPDQLFPSYVFGVMVVGAALVVTAYEAYKAARAPY
jgi:DNA-binding transcriptional ArsR family regulator